MDILTFFHFNKEMLIAFELFFGFDASVFTAVSLLWTTFGWIVSSRRDLRTLFCPVESSPILSSSSLSSWTRIVCTSVRVKALDDTSSSLWLEKERAVTSARVRTNSCLLYNNAVVSWCLLLLPTSDNAAFPQILEVREYSGFIPIDVKDDTNAADMMRHWRNVVVVLYATNSDIAALGHHGCGGCRVVAPALAGFYLD